MLLHVIKNMISGNTLGEILVSLSLIFTGMSTLYLVNESAKVALFTLIPEVGCLYVGQQNTLR